MKRIRLLVSVAVLGLALLPSSAIASTTYSESVFGVETGIPTSCGGGGSDSLSSFAGIASGTINGGFQIAVCHTPLGPGGATIVGGTFVISNFTTTVRGAFGSGTVFPPSTSVSGSLCIQTYAVSGALVPPGLFTGKLVHYGFLIGSSCNVFFATISGKANFTTT